MPKIKAYKANGVIIPVADAKISTAYCCPWTKKLFGTKQSYVKHLAELRINRMHRRIREDIQNRKIHDLWNQTTFMHIINWIKNNPDFMFDNLMRNSFERNMEKYRDKFWIKITYLDLIWSSSCSNSHSCPRDGVTNWGGKDCFNDGTTKPTGYPGWTGRIEYQVSHDITFGSNFMRGLGIHTGTGGSVNRGKYGFAVTFFEADWPGLQQLSTYGKLSETTDWQKVKYGIPHYFR